MKKLITTTITAAILSMTFAINANAYSYGSIWINPYFKSDGSVVTGHYRTLPDGYCWNNFSGC